MTATPPTTEPAKPPASMWLWFRVPMALYDRLADVGRAACTYLVLAKHCNSRGESWPSQKTIAKTIGVSERSVREHLATLQSVGLIHRRQRRRETEIYTLPDLLALDKTGSVLPVKTTQDRNQDSGQGGQDRKCISNKSGSVLPTNYTIEPERKARARFRPPTLDEVRSYCRERDNKIDPQQFVDHYESNGWMVGRTKMKDWRASVRTWESNEFNSGNGSGQRLEDRPLRPVN